jgi:Carboxypeptidase regulatory-like domain
LAALAASCLAQDANRVFHISGTVTNSQTGQPVKQALVVTTAPTPSKPASNSAVRVAKPRIRSQQIPTLSDGAGNFSLTGLGAGTYSLTVQKNGYTLDPGTVQEAVEVGPSRDAVALRLLPLGKIAGRVTDSEGDPVPGVSVRAVRVLLQDGRRSFEEQRPGTTDDRGQYRLWNLESGEYYIAAAGRSGGTLTYVGPLSSGGVHEGFAPVYYPAASDRASATPIALAPGQEFAADLKVAMQPAFRVRGTLRNVSVREPVKVELLRGAGETGANRVLVNGATGRFEANDVVPGTYLLRASQGEGETETRGERHVQVGRADVDGLVVELVAGVTVTGVVRSGQVDVRRGRTFPPRCDVILFPAETEGNSDSALIGSSDEDGKFTIDGVHTGHYRVHVQAFGGYVASLVSGTTDLSKGAELVIGPGTPPEPLEVVLRSDGGSIAGTIDESAKLANGAWVVLAPAVGGEAESAIVSLGKFEFQGLAPGDYQVYLFKDMENIEYRNPEVLRGLRGGESVHVTAGGQTTVTLKTVAQ